MKSELIEEIIHKIEASVRTEPFLDVEKSIIELKDLSSGNDWKSMRETVCAYLNTNGGYILGGVREREESGKKTYKITGFRRNNESNIIDLQSKFFKNDNDVLVDLTNNISLEYFNILDSEILVVAVHALSDDKKFVRYEGKYYERVLTQDKQITASKLQRQREYRAEIEFAKEIATVDKATLNDLSLDKLNEYVRLLNVEIRNTAPKLSLNKAKPFLAAQHFIQQDSITTLGMLVCGEDPFQFLGARAEVNCYYDTQIGISRDKKLFRNDVISLMGDTYKYIWGNIRIGRMIQEGGISKPEYPEKLVREVINNALAHRDYTLEGFITVTVEPEKWIEIKNPGSFKEKIKFIDTQTDIPIRRLLSGIAESKNPRLASVLKVFDKIENQGRGMASLVNGALDNLIDLPYYELGESSISLRVPAGKLLDESFKNRLTGFDGYIKSKLKKALSDEHKLVLAYFYKSEVLNKRRYFTILLSENNNHFMVIDELKEAGLIVEHSSSTDATPIYILDRVLAQNHYQDDLISLFGASYIDFDDTAKEVLNIIYRFTRFNDIGQKPAELTPEVYRRLFDKGGQSIDPKKYETLGRKIRNICSQFEKEGIMAKDHRNAYTLKLDYKQTESLF